MRHATFLVMAIFLAATTAPILSLAQQKRTQPVIDVAIPAPFPDAKASFEEAMEILKSESYNADLNDEIAYYSALSGILRRISPENNKDLSTIWPPEKDKIVRSTIAGRIGSIGIRFLHDPNQGTAVVSDVMPGTPAERLGMKTKDVIEAIDGVSLRGKSTNEIADMIQRPVGTLVSLDFQRGKKKMSAAIACEEIKVDDVRGEMVEGFGLLRLRYFSESTADDFARAMAEFKETKARGVIIDLRNNSGGLFQNAIQIADQLLKKNAIALYTVGRDGIPQRYMTGSDGDVKTPLAVLVNRESGSASEILAAALRGNKRAIIVGERTIGKATMEKMVKLKNGYTMKFTTAALYGPDGITWQNTGITPDREISLEPTEVAAAFMEDDSAVQLAKDKQLAAALAELKR